MHILKLFKDTIQPAKSIIIHRIFFPFILICFLLSNFIVNARESTDKPVSIQEKINLIHPLDRQNLEFFFRSLFLNGDFSYTLFGDKPLGSIDVLFGADFLNKQVIVDFVGWKLWQRYRYLFPLSNFCLLYYDRITSISFFGFNIVNKKRCQEVIHKNLSAFRSCFSFQDVDDLVEKLCSQGFYSSKLEDCHDNFYLCLGLLFGYGEKSAALFERKMQLRRLAAQYPCNFIGLNQSDLESICFLDKTKITTPACSLSIQNIISELNDLELKKHFSFTTKIDNPLYPIKINGFVTFDDDSEIEIIQNKNDALREKLVKIYYSPNFLEIILERLSQ